VQEPLGPVDIGHGKEQLIKRLRETQAHGGTALYDAIAAGHALALRRARAFPGRIHALLVMTDGQDEHSKLSLVALKQQLAAAADDRVIIFTIAYGDKAEDRVLREISEAAHGATERGSVDTIVQVYRDMASYF
jgi:Ca-activated chloride channel family protein